MFLQLYEYFDINEIDSKNLVGVSNEWVNPTKDLVLTYKPSKTGIWK